MSRMKTFFTYALLIILFFFYSNLAIDLLIKNSGAGVASEICQLPGLLFVTACVLIPVACVKTEPDCPVPSLASLARCQLWISGLTSLLARAAGLAR